MCELWREELTLSGRNLFDNYETIQLLCNAVKEKLLFNSFQMFINIENSNKYIINPHCFLDFGFTNNLPLNS